MCFLKYFLQPLTCWYSSTVCVFFRWLWRPVLWDRRDRQLEWWGPGAAVILTQTSVSLCERKILLLLENSRYCASSPSGINQQKRHTKAKLLYSLLRFCTLHEGFFVHHQYFHTEVKQCHRLWRTIMQYNIIILYYIKILFKVAPAVCESSSW